jgi:hypothetical protein
MNFLIDANLPRRLVSLFTERGHYAIHTLDLPDGNATIDSEVLRVADEKIGNGEKNYISICLLVFCVCTKYPFA